jgi:hypothetical protein
MSLFEREHVGRPIRLVGFGVSHLVAPGHTLSAQQELFVDLAGKAQDDRNNKLDQAVDALRHAFGSEAIKRGKWEKGTRP